MEGNGLPPLFRGLIEFAATTGRPANPAAAYLASPPERVSPAFLGLSTWVDLNAPCHGTWAELYPLKPAVCQRRNEIARLYGGLEDPGEEIPPPA